jgi:anthranilate phosphoribosyltransferase
MEIKTQLTTLIERRNLSEAECAEVVDGILAGELEPAQIGAFLGALAVKGVCGAELAGAARAMRRHAIRVQAVGQTVMDTCGTGGDGAHTFNISTTTAFVLAGCDVAVAKHGNRAASSQCGSADVLEALGMNLNAPPEFMEQALNEIGVAFLFAQRFHGAMRHAAPVRKALGVRTLFNLLGPLANPAGANRQLLGVYAPELTEMVAEALRLLGTQRAFVVHGHDGLDEISICAPTRVTELKDGCIRTYDLDPTRYFGAEADPGALRGGAPTENAAILRNILAGETGPRRDIVLLNTAAALVAADKVETIETGLEAAARAIDSGAAIAKLEALVEAGNA